MPILEEVKCPQCSDYALLPGVGRCGAVRGFVCANEVCDVGVFLVSGLATTGPANLRVMLGFVKVSATLAGSCLRKWVATAGRKADGWTHDGPTERELLRRRVEYIEARRARNERVWAARETAREAPVGELGEEDVYG